MCVCVCVAPVRENSWKDRNTDLETLFRSVFFQWSVSVWSNSWLSDLSKILIGVKGITFQQSDSQNTLLFTSHRLRFCAWTVETLLIVFRASALEIVLTIPMISSVFIHHLSYLLDRCTLSAVFEGENIVTSAWTFPRRVKRSTPGDELCTIRSTSDIFAHTHNTTQHTHNTICCTRFAPGR